MFSMWILLTYRGVVVRSLGPERGTRAGDDLPTRMADSTEGGSACLYPRVHVGTPDVVAPGATHVLDMPTRNTRHSVARMSDGSFQDDVLNELGDDRLQEIAGLLGTDTAGAQRLVGSSVSELSGELRLAASEPGSADEVRKAVDEAASSEPPLQGVAGFGGLVSGGLMAGVLARLAKPAANAVAKKTGLPPATVNRALDLLVPVVLAVVTKRAATKNGGLGDILGGGGPKK